MKFIVANSTKRWAGATSAILIAASFKLFSWPMLAQEIRSVPDLPQVNEGASVYEVQVPENRVADLDARSLESKAATAQSLAKALAEIGQTKVLCKVDQTVNLFGESIHARHERTDGDQHARQWVGSVGKVRVEPGSPDLLEGEIYFLAAAIDEATRTFHVKAKLAESNHRLWPGMSATVILDVPVKAASDRFTRQPPERRASATN
jgi:multidrug efflux pump subunit AcrA (membrane-fusion protein)